MLQRADVTERVPLAFSIDARLILDEIKKLGITHVITVPDTAQKTLLDLIEADPDLELLPVCTEDEGIAINAGLYIGGKTPMMLIQQNGIFASVNALKGIALDARVPTFMLAGLYGRDVTKPAAENNSRAVRMAAPTLEAWGIPWLPLESEADLGNIASAYELCLAQPGPAAVLVGAPTA